MRKLQFFGLFVLAALMATSCGKSVEGEKASFDANVKTAQEAALDFPSFKTVIQEQIASATAAFEQAATASGEEAQIEAMSKANQMLNTGFIADLGKVKELKDKITAQERELDGMNLQEGDRRKARRMLDDSWEAVRGTERMLGGSVASVNDANTMAAKAKKDLEKLVADLGSLISGFAAQTAPGAGQADSTQADSTQAAQVAEHTCEYCEKKYPGEKTECPHCGAPR